jgi:uncharacterized protein (TIGR02996 family)
VISPEEAAFLATVHDQPGDETARLVYADWLDEHGEPEKAAYLRSLVQLRRQIDEVSEAQLLIDQDWLESISGTRDDKYESHLLTKGLQFLTLEKVRKWAGDVASPLVVDYNSLLGHTISERRESLYLEMTRMLAAIRRQLPKMTIAWACCSPEIASIFETASRAFGYSEFFPEYPAHGENDPPVYTGRFVGFWHMYTHARLPPDWLVVGVGRNPGPGSVGLIRVVNFVL